MSNIISFPEPEKLPDIESFPIYLNNDTMEILMPIVPDTEEKAAFVFGNFATILLEDGILTKD